MLAVFSDGQTEIGHPLASGTDVHEINFTPIHGVVISRTMISG
jgi:hypothetical protein